MNDFSTFGLNNLESIDEDLSYVESKIKHQSCSNFCFTENNSLTFDFEAENPFSKSQNYPIRRIFMENEPWFAEIEARYNKVQKDSVPELSSIVQGLNHQVTCENSNKPNISVNPEITNESWNEESKENVELDEKSSSDSGSEANNKPLHSVSEDNSESEESFHEIIVEKIHRYLQGRTIIPKGGRGRPRGFKGINHQGLVSLFQQHVSSSVIENQRGDAEKTTLKRTIQKFPQKLLDKIASPTHYKSSSKLRLVAYLESFLIGFLPLFDAQRDIVTPEHVYRVFLDYIVLSFPKNQTKLILDMIEESYDIIPTYFAASEGKTGLDNNGKTTIKSFKEKYQNNQAFMLIVDQFPRILSTTVDNGTFSRQITVLASIKSKLII